VICTYCREDILPNEPYYATRGYYYHDDCLPIAVREANGRSNNPDTFPLDSTTDPVGTVPTITEEDS
jgi:hypothetical protein